MLLAAIFSDQAKARRGAQALHGLHATGVATLFAHALIERDRRRYRLDIREPFHEGMVAAAPGAAALVGSLVSLVGGPMTAAMVTVESGLVAAMRDAMEAGLDPTFLEEVAARLRPGSFGIFAELEMEDPGLLASAMAPLGGRLMRQEGRGFRLEEVLLHETEAMREGLDRAPANPAASGSDAAAGTRRRAGRAELRRSMNRARAFAGALRREAVAKVAVLRAQAALAAPAARAMVEARAGRVRTELEERARRLDRLVEDMEHLCPPPKDRSRR